MRFGIFKKTICFMSAAMIGVSLAACGMPADPDGGSDGSFAPSYRDETLNGGELDNYQTESIKENDFVDTAITPDSYFSLDRNTASYTYMRRIINSGKKVSSGSVRLEEYINYFSYDYARPSDGSALAVSGSVFDCPWNDEHKLMSVSVAAEEVEYSSVPNNIVFLIDTSGSMYGDDRLGLIQQSFSMLTDSLDELDTVSIVTYAGDSRVALEGESGENKTRIANVLQDLNASGSTNGQGGIQKAYSVAQKYYRKNANNRVILATDGDFNVGASSKSELIDLIARKRAGGIYLSVLGVGMYNTNDTTMKTLAENGNGNYAYLDSVAEARKVLVTELGGTFNVVAKDAKMSVSFDPETVEKYRLLGYESKLLSQEEFDDPDTDAGEIGSGHTVTALYEIVIDESSESQAIATCKVRYKVPDTDGNDSVSAVISVHDYSYEPNEDMVFIGCVAEYGLLLRASAYKGNASFDAVIDRLAELDCTAPSVDPFKAEFADLVQKAKTIYIRGE